jgi:hypothetical protein
LVYGTQTVRMKQGGGVVQTVGMDGGELVRRHGQSPASEEERAAADARDGLEHLPLHVDPEDPEDVPPADDEQQVPTDSTRKTAIATSPSLPAAAMIGSLWPVLNTDPSV